MVRVYQLRDRKAVDAVDYQTQLRNADRVLKDDVLASKSLLVMSKGSVALNMPMDEDTQFVAVVGLFNRPAQKDNRWRLVDSKGQLRGKGTELRTDEWGTLRAGKGLFVAADAQAKAEGDALDMNAALKEIDRLNQQLQQLEMAAEQALALKGDVDSQIAMFEQRLKPPNEAVLFSAPEGMALTSGEDMQLAAGRNLALNAGEDFSVGVMGNATTLTGEKLGLFARTGQLSLKSGEGPVEVQAQNASMRLFAEKKLTLSSASDISFAGKKRITLIGGGSYLKLEVGKVEYGTTASYIRKVKRTMAAGAATLPLNIPEMYPAITEKICIPCLLKAIQANDAIVQGA